MAESSDQMGTIAVRIRYFAAARAATGVDSEVLTLDAPASVRETLHLAGELHGPRLVTVLARCSFLLEEIAVHDQGANVTDGDVLDVLPPFAGG